MSSKKSSRLENVGVLVFGVIAFVAGWLAVICGIEQLSLFVLTNTWTETTASVEGVDLIRTGSRGSRTVTARYRYTVDGCEYTGRRVGLSRGGDNFSSWGEDVYSRLSSARSSGKPVPCFVNPRRPDQAVLDRTLRPGVLALQLGVGGVFAALGTLLAVAFLYALLTKLKSTWRGQPASKSVVETSATPLDVTTGQDTTH